MVNAINEYGLLIEFVIPNLSQIYFGIPEAFKTNVKIIILDKKNYLSNLCSKIMNSQRLFCTQNPVLNIMRSIQKSDIQIHICRL